MNAAAMARAAKAAHPEHFCPAPGCLWRTHNGRTGERISECQRHPAKRLGYSIDFQCAVQQLVRAHFPDTQGPVLSAAELRCVESSWRDGFTALQTANVILRTRERRAVDWRASA